jgi:TRAP-type C4-dicarboxylate transport system permease small subunit
MVNGIWKILDIGEDKLLHIDSHKVKYFKNPFEAKFSRPYHRITPYVHNVILVFFFFSVWTSINVFAHNAYAWVTTQGLSHSHIDRGSNFSNICIAQGHYNVRYLLNLLGIITNVSFRSSATL